MAQISADTRGMLHETAHNVAMEAMKQAQPPTPIPGLAGPSAPPVGPAAVPAPSGTPIAPAQPEAPLAPPPSL
jgi:hypothetical protein